MPARPTWEATFLARMRLSARAEGRIGTWRRRSWRRCPRRDWPRRSVRFLAAVGLEADELVWGAERPPAAEGPVACAPAGAGADIDDRGRRPGCAEEVVRLVAGADIVGPGLIGSEDADCAGRQTRAVSESQAGPSDGPATRVGRTGDVVQLGAGVDVGDRNPGAPIPPGGHGAMARRRSIPGGADDPDAASGRSRDGGQDGFVGAEVGRLDAIPGPAIPMQHEGHGACPGAAVAHGPGVVAGRRHDVREHALGAQPGSPQARPVAPGASVDDGLELRAGTAIPDDPEPTTTVARYTRQVVDSAARRAG